MAWLALAACLALQDPAEAAPGGELERLRRENGDLREQLELLERQAIEDAQTIARLRQALASVEQAASRGSAESDGINGASRAAAGPVEVLKGRVLGVNARMGFILVNLGEKQGVRPGYRFEILRPVYEGGESRPRLQKIALAECEKFIGEDAKLKVIEGNAADIRVEDEAVAIRHLPPVDPAPAAPRPEAAAPAQPGVYRITGIAGSGFVINYGSSEGAQQTQLVYVYRDGKFKARLRIDTVERAFSVANVVRGSEVAAPEEGDQVYLREIRKAVIGRVRINDEQRGIFIDVGARNYGVKNGHTFEVRRAGKPVGHLVVQTALDYGCWARPAPGLRREDVQLGDFVELVEDK